MYARYAGAHRERVDGKEYPSGLKRDEMPLLARCMAIADIFEALTAGNRPYKKGETLSIHEAYAARFLSPEQRGEVRLAALRRYVPPPSS